MDGVTNPVPPPTPPEKSEPAYYIFIIHHSPFTIKNHLPLKNYE